MNKFKKNIMPEKAANKTQARLLFINDLVRRRRTEAGAGILALVALHFVSQFIFFPEENFLSRKRVVEEKTVQRIMAENAPQVSQQPDAEVKNAAAETPPIAEPIALSAPKTAAPTTTKKQPEAREPKETREAKTQRLRRAERLLTGN